MCNIYGLHICSLKISTKKCIYLQVEAIHFEAFTQNEGRRLAQVPGRAGLVQLSYVLDHGKRQLRRYSLIDAGEDIAWSDLIS